MVVGGVGDEVIVTFLHGDLAHPIVIGSVWNGGGQPPEDTPSEDVKTWSINGRNGTRIAIDERQDGSDIISLETPGGAKVVCTGSERIEIDLNGSETITLSNGAIDIVTSGTISVQSSKVEMQASSANITCPMTTFSGTVQCNTLIATSVLSSSYSPGAGNVW